MASNTIFNFNHKSDLKNWVIVDDVVMGGKSSGSFNINHEGHGVFHGSVSLANNGGFSSVRHNFERKSIVGFTKVILKIKGDGKNYQFRLKSDTDDYFWYITTISTTHDWQELKIQLKDMYPSFRGGKLAKPNFSSDYIEQLAFLIGNKQNEDFKFLIDSITLE